MEWVTHTTTGFFLGQLMVPEGHRPKRAGWWWALAAISPDWLEFGTRWFGDIHRGVTHSLYFWPILALGWAGAVHTWGRQTTVEIASLIRLWLAFIVVVGSHLFLDVLISYRWYLAWPFSKENWAWGIMPFFDVYIFVGWLALWWFNRRLRLSSATTAKLGLAVFLLMFTARAAGKLRANYLTSSGLMSMTGEVQTRPAYYQAWIWFVRDEGLSSDWLPLNVLTGKYLEGYTRGQGFPPTPGKELVPSREP